MVRGPKIGIAPEKLAEFQHAPLSISEEVHKLEAEHQKYEDLLSFMASSTPNPQSVDAEEDPREDAGAGTAGTPNQESVDYVTMDSLSALEALAPGLIEHQCAGDKHVTMYKDERRKEVWLLSKLDDHIVPKATVFGGFGSGHMAPRKTDTSDCVPWSLPDGDKTYVQLVAADEVEAKTKPQVGTLNTVIKPLEVAASKKGAPLTLTSYGKVGAKVVLLANMDLASSFQMVTLSTTHRTTS